MIDQRGDSRPSSEPPPSTLRALKQQMTPKLRKELLRYAQKRAQLLRHAGVPVSEMYAQELVDDAHADTRVGLLLWNPLQCELDEHLGQAIKKRTWRELQRARRIMFVSLQEAANDETVLPQMEHALAHASQSGCNPIRLYEMASMACQQLQLLLPHNTEIAAVVKCWEKGIVERNEIMKITGLTEVAYQRARKRLLYTSRHLPSELREAAQDLLRSAS
jgi:hypothetical protein